YRRRGGGAAPFEPRRAPERVAPLAAFCPARVSYFSIMSVAEGAADFPASDSHRRFGDERSSCRGHKNNIIASHVCDLGTGGCRKIQKEIGPQPRELSNHAH